MAPSSDRLREEFDRRLGRRSPVAARANRPSPNYVRASRTPRNTSQVTRTRIGTGAVSLPADVKKSYIQQFGRNAVGGIDTPASSFQRTMNHIVESTIRDIQDNSLEEVVERNRTEQAIEKADDGGWWKGLMEGFGRSPVGRALDLVSRPAYGVFEGLQSALEAGYGTDDNTGKDDLLHSFDDLGEGFWRGFSGQEKTGAGDVWQTMKDNSNIVGMEELRNLEETHPEIAKWTDRVIGFGGEVTMDPLNWITGGSAAVLRNSGKQLTESTAKAAVRETVDSVARDFFDNSVAHTGGLRRKPSQEAMAIYATQAAEEQLEKNLLEISSGSHAGWGKLNTELNARSTANKVTSEIRTNLLKFFDDTVDNEIIKALETKGLVYYSNQWRIGKALKESPEFSEFMDQLTTELAKKGRTYATNDALLNSLKKSDIPLVRKLADNVRDSFDSSLQVVYDDVYTGIRELAYNTIGLRVGNRTLPFKTFGRAYASVKGKTPTRTAETLDDIAANMSFERNFPGRISLMTQANRSIGTQIFEQFRDKWAKVAKTISPDDDKLLYRWLDGRVSALPPELQKIGMEIKRELNIMYAKEYANGARTNRFADNYMYIINKGGSKDNRGKFKDLRKEAVQKNGNVQGYGWEKAKAMGLKPSESAMESLIARKQHSIRDLTRAYFMKDLIENFGITSKPYSKAGKVEQGLITVAKSKLPLRMQHMMDEQGVVFYLPKTHMDLFDTYVKLSKWNSQDQSRLIREWAKLTNGIKYMSTVPRLGFHTKNMLGDFFMGLLDKVPTKTYSEVIQKATRWKAGANPAFRISDDMTKSFTEMKALYDQHADSGFFSTEIPVGSGVQHAGQIARNSVKKLGNTIREGSDLREEFGRFVHFVAAFRQEINAFKKVGYKGTRLEEKAIEASVRRVNLFKFDYNALTATERKIKLAFPFYTFTRKAIPSLMQALFLNPKYMSLQSRFMQYNDGSAADMFNSMYLPEYVKDTGYAFLDEESEEPLYMRGDISPVSALDTFDFTNTGDFAQSVAQMVNPMAQMPFELGMGEQIFSGRPTGSLPEYLLNKFSFPGQFARQTGMMGQNEDPGWLQKLNESWTGLGIPVDQFSKSQQDFGFRETEDRLIQDPFREFNYSQDKFRVVTSNRREGQSFKVVNNATGETVWEGTDPRQALEAAKRITD